MGNNASFDEQKTEIKTPRSETWWQRWRRLANLSTEVTVVSILLGSVFIMVGTALNSDHLSFGAIVEQIGAYIIIVGISSPLWLGLLGVGLFLFFGFRKRQK